MARRFAVAMSQAPGLFGTPDAGQLSSATMSVSCASSSATPTSPPSIRASFAMSFGDSMRKTARIARSVSVATEGNRYLTSRSEASSFAKLRRKVRNLQNLTDLDHVAFGRRAAFGPFHRLFLRPHLDHPVTGENFLHVAEGTVGDRGLFPREGDARPHRWRMQTVEREEDPRLVQGLVVLAHGGDHFGVGQGARWCSGVALR